MKGNDVRIVFFLQPVDQFKDGEVTKMESPLRNYFSFWISLGFCALFLISLVLALALTLKEGPPQPVVTTTTVNHHNRKHHDINSHASKYYISATVANSNSR